MRINLPTLLRDEPKKITVYFLFLFFWLQAQETSALVKRINMGELGIFGPEFVEVRAGSVYIYDNKRGLFFIVGNNGVVVKTFGKLGEGPEEFNRIVSCGFYKDRLWAEDLSGKILFYSMQGNFEKELKRSEKNPINSVILSIINDNCRLIQKKRINNSLNIISTVYLERGEKKSVLLEFTWPLSQQVDLGSIPKYAYTCMENACYIVPDTNLFTIRAYDLKSGKCLHELVRRDYKRESYSPQEIAEIKKELERLKKKVPFLQQVQIKLCELKPAINGICSDERGNLYVMTNRKRSDGNLVEIFSSELRLCGQVFVMGDKLFAVENEIAYTGREEDEGFVLTMQRLGKMETIGENIEGKSRK